MFAGRLTQFTLRALDWLTARTLPPEDTPSTTEPAGVAKKTRISICGGAATRLLPQLRSPHHRGELDLVAGTRRPVRHRSENSHGA